MGRQVVAEPSRPELPRISYQRLPSTMPVADYLVLSSSPLSHATLTKSHSTSHEVAPPSSSDLPSPSQLLETRTVRHAASGAAYPNPDHSPDDQTRSKTSDMRFMLKAKELLAGLEPKPLASVKKIQKNRQESDGQTTNGGKMKSTHNNLVPKDIERGEQGSLKIKRSKHFAKDAQTKIGKTNITKPGAGTSGPKLCKSIVTEAKTDSGDARCDAEAEQRTEKDCKYSLGLTEALRRRRDWTPLKETPVGRVDETGLTWTVSASLEVQNGGFGKLVEDFGYLDTGNATVISAEAARKASGASGTKRRRLNVSFTSAICFLALTSN